MILERVLILALIAMAGLLCYGVWRWQQDRCLRRLATADSPAPLHKLLAASGPAILYFTAEDCTQCRLRQAPILNLLAQHLAIAVHVVDAPSQAELVRHYGIMTVPSTVVLNRELRPAAINHGLADLARLRAQLEGIG